MAFLASVAGAGIVRLISAMKQEKSPTVYYEMKFPPGMKFKLIGAWMDPNLFKVFDFAKYNDTSSHELGGTTLEACGSGYVIFYSEEHNMGLILTFSNPDVGCNKINGEMMHGKPTAKRAREIWDKKMNNDTYGREECVSTLGPAKLYCSNQSGNPARGYWKIVA